MRERGTTASAPTRAPSPRAEAARGARARAAAAASAWCRARCARSTDRIGDADAALERLGIVVGHLVRRDVGPHLQRAHRGVARARARDEHADRDRRGAAGAGHDRRREPQAAADERRRDARDDAAPAAARMAEGRRTTSRTIQAPARTPPLGLAPVGSRPWTTRRSRSSAAAASCASAQPPRGDERLEHAVRARPARAVEAAAEDDEVRAVVMTGAGRAFSSGADLKAGFDPTPDGKPDVHSALNDRYHPIIVGLRRMPKPVVAAVNGPAVGIGLSLALAADLVIAKRERLLPARLREHRPRARRRLLAVRPRARSGSRARPRWRCSASACPRRQALEWGLINRVARRRRVRRRGRRARRAPRHRARRAPSRAPSASSTRGCTRGWTPSSSWRPRSSRNPRHRATSGGRAGVPGEATARVQGNLTRYGPLRTPAPYTPPPHALSCSLTRGLAVALLAPLAARGASAAHAGMFFPETGGSPNADKIHTLYLLIFVLAWIVFIGVAGALVWAMIKFRARKGAVAAQIHGNTRLEIGWTVGAAVILVFITVFTFIMLPGIKNPPRLRHRRERQPGRLQRALRLDGPARRRRRAAPASTSGSTASSTCGATSTRAGRGRLLLRRHGRPRRHDRHARHHGRRRHPLMVDPQAGRQDGRRPGLHQQDLVQDPASARSPRARTRWSSTASAPSCAGATTPTWSPA